MRHIFVFSFSLAANRRAGSVAVNAYKTSTISHSSSLVSLPPPTRLFPPTPSPMESLLAASSSLPAAAFSPPSSLSSTSSSPHALRSAVAGAARAVRCSAAKVLLLSSHPFLDSAALENRAFTAVPCFSYSIDRFCGF